MTPLTLIVVSILLVKCYSHQHPFNKPADPSVQTSVNQKRQYSDEKFSKADIPDYNFIKKEDKNDKRNQQAAARKVRQKRQISYQPIFTVDSSGYNFISPDDINFISEEDENGKTDLPIAMNSVKQEQPISSQPNFTTDPSDYNFIRKEDKKDKIDRPVTKKSEKREQKFSYEPIFTTDSPNYNFPSKEDKKDKKASWGLIKKLLTKNKKGNYTKLQKSDEEKNDNTAEGNAKGNKEWAFTNNPFISSETDFDSAESTSSKSGFKLPKQMWPRSFSSLSSLSRSFSSSLSSSSSSSTSEMDRLIDKLLDDYDGKSVDEEVVGPVVEPTAEEVVEAEGVELPKKPVVSLENFSLCSEVYSSELHVLDIFSDGKAPTCIFACLFYKIKHSVFVIRPEGRCGRLSSHGPGLDAASITKFACICNRGIQNKHRYKILQLNGTLYYVHNVEFGFLYPIGTVEEIFHYVEKHFRQYLKDFLKDKRGIDWKSMYEYVRDFRWNRHDSDDRPVGQYLSESLKKELDDIKSFWTVDIHTLLLRIGNNRTRLW